MYLDINIIVLAIVCVGMYVGGFFHGYGIEKRKNPNG